RRSAEATGTKVGRVTAGKRVEVTADTFPDRKFGGTVFRVSSRLAGKAIQTGRPADRVDAKVLQVLIDLDKLPIGLRVDAYFLNEPAVKREPTESEERSVSTDARSYWHVSAPSGDTLGRTAARLPHNLHGRSHHQVLCSR